MSPIGLLYRTLFTVAIGLVVWALAAVMASGTLSEGARLGLRGIKRGRALAGGGLFGSLDPVIRWFARRASGFLSEGQRRALDRKLTLAGDPLGLQPEEFVGLWALSGVTGAVLGAGLAFLCGLPLALGAVPFVGVVAPYVYLTGEIDKRARSVSRELPYAIDLLALAMGAGQDFAGAVRQYIEKSQNRGTPLVEELQLLLWQLQTGQTRRHALHTLATRVPIESIQEFTHAALQAEERGNPLAETLRVQAQASRMRRSVRAEEAAAKAGVKMVAPLFLLFGAVMLLVMTPVAMTLQKSL